MENIQRRRNLFQYFTQDAGSAQAAARSLLDVSEQFQRVRFGAGAGPDQFLAAQRLGFDPAELIQGRLNQRQILEQAISGVQGLPDVEARLRLEQVGFSEDVRAAVLVGSREGLSAAVVYQQRQAVLSEEQLEANRSMGRNVDEILTQISRLVQLTLSGIAPPLLSMSSSHPEVAGRAGGRPAGGEPGADLPARRGGAAPGRRAGGVTGVRRRATPLPQICRSPRQLLAANRELSGIDKRLAEIDDRLAHFRGIDLAGQYPGPLGSIPGAEGLAERGVSAGDIGRYAGRPRTKSGQRRAQGCVGHRTAGE